MEVTISAPISNREQYLPTYLKSILSQSYPKELTNLYFLINNSQDTSYQILKNFQKDYKTTYPKITIKIYNNDKIPSSTNRFNRVLSDDVYQHLADIRNMILEDVDTKWVFSLDSDIMIPPNALELLINSDKKVVSGLVCNGHEYVKMEKKSDPYKFTNAMYLNIRGMYTHIRKSQLKGIIEVDMTGAAILIEKSIYQNCKYMSHPQGEDIPFCQDVKKLKEKIYCNTDVRLAHCMNLELLEGFKMGEFFY